MVSERLKQRIWADEFIDFEQLLTNKHNQSIAIKLDQSQEGTAVALSQASAAKQITSINKWIDAFLIFMTVLIKKQPMVAGDLIKYLSFIRSLSTKFPGNLWASYDYSYRAGRVGLCLKWSQVDWELYHYLVPLANTFQPGPAKPQALCWHYNKRGCFNKACTFSHTCANCGGKHSRSSCNQLQNQPVFQDRSKYSFKAKPANKGRGRGNPSKAT